LYHLITIQLLIKFLSSLAIETKAKRSSTGREGENAEEALQKGVKTENLLKLRKISSHNESFKE
jgi:hypothetical protein